MPTRRPSGLALGRRAAAPRGRHRRHRCPKASSSIPRRSCQKLPERVEMGARAVLLLPDLPQLSTADRRRRDEELHALGLAANGLVTAGCSRRGRGERRTGWPSCSAPPTCWSRARARTTGSSTSSTERVGDQRLQFQEAPSGSPALVHVGPMDRPALQRRRRRDRRRGSARPPTCRPAAWTGSRCLPRRGRRGGARPSSRRR